MTSVLFLYKKSKHIISHEQNIIKRVRFHDHIYNFQCPG